ncbi:SAF domain-containing protein [Staphylococcus chromogenes]|nr:SAF domain-containing protein [Staphylococcus chromogenes]
METKFLSRFTSASTTPHWKRTQLARKLLALSLCALAAALAWRDSLTKPPQVVVVKHAIAAGDSIKPEDLALADASSASRAEDALRSLADAEGKTSATALRPGDILTQRSFLGEDLSRALATAPGEEPLALVPVKLADPATAALIRPGARVSVIKSPTDAPGAQAEVLATGARVIFTVEKDKGKLGAGTVLLALPASTGHAVAAASLVSPLTVIMS